MMQKISKRSAINIENMLQKFTNAHHKDMKAIFRDAGQLNPRLEEACERVYNYCTICASSGRPYDLRKVPIDDVNLA